MGSLLLYLLVHICLRCIHSWSSDSTLTSLLQNTFLHCLHDYTLAYSPFANTLGIYGGVRPSSTSSYISGDMYLFSLTSQYISIVVQDNTSPTPRYSSCSFIVDYNQASFMYIYGGSLSLDNPNTISNELWRFDMITHQWTLLATAAASFNDVSCKMSFITNRQVLRILGGINTQLSVLYYSIDLNTLTTFSLIYCGYTQVNTTMWDGTQTTVLVDVYYFDNFHTSYNCVTKTLSTLQDLTFLCVIEDYIDTVLLTNLGIYRLSLSISLPNTIVMSYLRSISLPNLSLPNPYNYCNCLRVYSYTILFSANYSASEFSMTFFTSTYTESFTILPTTTNNANNIFPIVNNNYPSFQLFIDTFGRIYFLALYTLSIYTLDKDLPYAKPYGLRDYFYGLTTCEAGRTGKLCYIPVCPNTLTLHSELILIRIECSGNGVCTSSGCVCAKNWGGTNCNIYLRKKCLGHALMNFPLQNCYCMNPKIGGNSCEVVFCYNDCLSKGVCNQSTGLCECYYGYFGADCSIKKIALGELAEMRTAHLLTILLTIIVLGV